MNLQDQSQSTAFNRFVSQRPWLIILLVAAILLAFGFFNSISQNAQKEADNRLREAQELQNR